MSTTELTSAKTSLVNNELFTQGRLHPELGQVGTEKRDRRLGGL